MPRYLLFMGENYYPVGGWDDYVASSDSIEELQARIQWRRYDPSEVIEKLLINKRKFPKLAERLDGEIDRQEALKGKVNRQYFLVGDQAKSFNWLHIVDLETMEICFSFTDKWANMKENTDAVS